MYDRTLMAKRVAMELRPGYLVNLGSASDPGGLIGATGSNIFFQSENGIIGTQARSPLLWPQWISAPSALVRAAMAG
jgi:acyl CoA:acetate/3-ketoacid CoA transferase beta subunit